jgi:hypothetical protein
MSPLHPLAARDLVTWVGSTRTADRAAVMRRIVKLDAAAWLAVERITAHKHRLLPTWGPGQRDALRTWRFDADDLGRPAHVRGRRVPLALLDTYIGRLDPQPGQMRALVSRYLTRPLIDLTDLGVYTIGLRAEIQPTPRLQHLGLVSSAGMLPPLEGDAVLARAAVGALTTLQDDTAVAVELTVQGYARLSIPVRIAESPAVYGCAGGSHGESDGRSEAQSLCRSQPGSPSSIPSVPHLVHQEALAAHMDQQAAQITWDDRDQESTNEESAAGDPVVGGGASIRVDAAVREECEPTAFVAPEVVTGHEALNVGRAIGTGEWWEIVALQERYGASSLLVWQARAARASTTRHGGVTPAYYTACAGSRAPLSPRPSSEPRSSSARPSRHRPAGDSEPERWSPAAQAIPPLDHACDSLLQAMGVRERAKLAGVAIDLITCWKEALDHPGLAAQFSNPVGFAVAQMLRRNTPPPIDELDRWARGTRREALPQGAWRHIEPLVVPPEAVRHEAQLEARVRAIAPPGADLTLLCELANLLEAGLSDEEARARFRTDRRGGVS